MGGAKSLEKDESISSIEEIEENDDTLTEIEESEIEDSDDDDLYAVERIVDKRILMNQVQYLIKWEGYPDSDNTWELRQNIDCEELLAEFEKNYMEKEKVPDANERKEPESADETKKDQKPEETTDSVRQHLGSLCIDNRTTGNGQSRDDTTNDEEGGNEEIGFGKGDLPEAILGATDLNGTLKFLIKWKGYEKATLVPSIIANVKCPQLVIKFYESRLMWDRD